MECKSQWQCWATLAELEPVIELQPHPRHLASSDVQGPGVHGSPQGREVGTCSIAIELVHYTNN